MAKVLVLAPHADDEVLGAGGTIARHVDEGDEVSVAILATGNPRVIPQEAVRTVLEEEIPAAHAALGVKHTRVGGFPAPGMDALPQHEITAVISAWLREFEPETIYIPHRGDIHLDHQTTHQAAMVAARPGRSTVRTILAYETLSETEWAGPQVETAFLPNLFVDISATLNRKLAAMRAYASQLQKFPHPRSLESIEALARLRGSSVVAPAAEAFLVARKVL